MQGPVYKDLKGATFAERRAECPVGYWYQKGQNDTEVWYDPHGMYCPLCKTGCVDTLPNPLPMFLCTACGFTFALDLLNDQDVQGRRVILYNPA